jgi:hypothetical protein
MPIEVVRRSYRPNFINVLLVGESAPVAGTFFYLGDTLTNYTKAAFLRAYGIGIESNMEFLDRFKLNDYYLEDLCLTPINHIDQSARRETRQSWVSSLSNRLRLYSPNAIICIMIAIQPYVIEAMKTAKIEDRPFYSIPFPSHGNHPGYIEQLSNSLIDLKSKKVIGETFL